MGSVAFEEWADTILDHPIVRSLSMISFKGKHFLKKLFLLVVRWYLSYALSYRDIEEMMLERGSR